jgi:NAD/NADP transhydrogenase beta subunit
MFQGLITVAYILAALCFIKALAGLSNQEKAKKRELVWNLRYGSGIGINNSIG